MFSTQIYSQAKSLLCVHELCSLDITPSGLIKTQFSGHLFCMKSYLKHLLEFIYEFKNNCCLIATTNTLLIQLKINHFGFLNLADHIPFMFEVSTKIFDKFIGTQESF